MKGSVRTYIFLIIQMVLYVLFQIIDITGGKAGLSNGIKYCIVISCFCYVLIRKCGTDKKDLDYLRGALFFTLVSDLIILFLDSGLYLYGMISFLAAQQLYGIRLTRLRKNRPVSEEHKLSGFLPLRLGFQLLLTMVLCFVLSFSGVAADVLIFVTILYFTSLIFNAVRSVRLAFLLPKDHRIVMFAFGLFLFLLCDINVGIFNLTDFIPLSGKGFHLLYSISALLMWTFYAPSQVLIALSSDEI